MSKRRKTPPRRNDDPSPPVSETGLVLPASVGRRLAASLYDGLLLLALWMSAALVEVLVTDALGLGRSPALTRALLLGIAAFFFAWCWTHGGQTLGGRAWRLRVERLDGQPLNLPTALLRFAAGITWLPLGVLWALARHDRQALHDQLSGTRVVLLPRS